MFKSLFGVGVTGFYDREMKAEYSVPYMIIYVLIMIVAFFVTSFGIRIALSIRSYEKTSKFPIFVLIASLNIGLASCFTILTVFFEIRFGFIIIIPLSYLLICFVLLSFLYKFNLSQFHKLNKYHREEYTLSRRFQLKENIRVLSLLMKMIYAVIIFIAIIVAGFTLPIFFNFGHLTSDFMRTVVDFCVHCNPCIVIPMTAFFIPEFKKQVKASLCKRVSLGRGSVDSHYRSYREDSNQADVYFDLFKKTTKKSIPNKTLPTR
ncbi:hypothetical protein GCK72_018406 [Caenorhabditis remanei]|uniref:Uncharacterized protein n=1 Tax=Caenorhabditis remanei TaxID=31234 RepID=A0A6A5GBQ5_CAERE|nr:hypothetical protein GCK72_018406 [Caenorhabditis remanei]KAF1751852.1 hypothetical protein GCK72_018406 [Caenorhabditis remanei]